MPAPAALAEVERLVSRGDAIADVAAHRVAHVQGRLDVLVEIAAGRTPEPESIAAELDLLLALIQRLDRTEHWREFIRVVRDAEAVFLLVRRSTKLADSIQRVLVTAQEVGDGLSRAWALHEFGTLALAAGEVDGLARHSSRRSSSDGTR